ncbi:flagellar protein FlhE [Kushneria sinocarnis]|uniref:flagellar protein FlhE n=1 Tax=Kushneria sinocarnis TaxID=595502 RepID=UPI0014761B98|nr:flagellar protein FlhE [Kushneria sinocarnis]
MLAPLPTRAAAGGAWIGDEQAPTLRHGGRDYHRTLTPPDGLPQGRVSTVSWRYELLPLNTALQAALCHRRHCVPLAAARGQTTGFAGLPVAGAWTFHFGMPGEGQRLAPRLRGGPLQLIVNYTTS